MTLACGIDFGTSNSAVALTLDGDTTLVNLEHRHANMPTAIFFDAETNRVTFGRHAIRQYVEGTEGRLMRGLKSVLGSSLVDDVTHVQNRTVSYQDIIAAFLRHLKAIAENDADAELADVVVGRPVFFVDDDTQRDRAAQRTLEECARRAGFREIEFEYEPIAAALDFEAGLDRECMTLIVDIGGGTSDFSVVRLGPQYRHKRSRADDILANLGQHIGGTDFDHLLSMASVMPLLGYRSLGPEGREVPSWIYFDLATWHRINALQSTKMVHEAKTLLHFYADTKLHARLMGVLGKRLGHLLLARVEDAKIASTLPESSGGGVSLDEVEAALATTVHRAMVEDVLAERCEAIVATAQRTVALAGLAPDAIDTLYFTGGSTGLPSLRQRLRAAFPRSEAVFGDPFGSVARGLGLRAGVVFA